MLEEGRSPSESLRREGRVLLVLEARGRFFLTMIGASEPELPSLSSSCCCCFLLASTFGGRRSEAFWEASTNPSPSSRRRRGCARYQH